MFSRRGKLSSRMIGLLILATFSVLIIILHRDAGPYKYLEPVHKAYENLRKVQHSIFSNDKFIRPKVGHSLKGHDPLLEPVGPPPGQLWGPGERGRAPATIMSLVRNEEVDDMVQSILELERTFNHKFNYPWTFFNDVPFSEEFKRKTREATKAEVSYGTHD